MHQPMLHLSTIIHDIACPSPPAGSVSPRLLHQPDLRLVVVELKDTILVLDGMLGVLEGVVRVGSPIASTRVERHPFLAHRVKVIGLSDQHSLHRAQVWL